jgi:hypothetical protein
MLTKFNRLGIAPRCKFHISRSYSQKADPGPQPNSTKTDNLQNKPKIAIRAIRAMRPKASLKSHQSQPPKNQTPATWKNMAQHCSMTKHLWTQGGAALCAVRSRRSPQGGGHVRSKVPHRPESCGHYPMTPIHPKSICFWRQPQDETLWRRGWTGAAGRLLLDLAYGTIFEQA